MSVRKRSWTTKGERKEAWVVDYVDAQGDRHIETFARQKDAKARHDKINTDVRKGVHVAASKTVTVAEAGENWLQTCGAAGLERTTVKTYGEQLQHIVALIGDMKLSAISVPVVRALQDRLRERKLSATMVRRVTQSLGAIIGDAQERGHCAHNAVPTVVAAGVVDRHGKPKYTGMHALRHFYASWCINRKEDSGRGLPPKIVQQRMGHATIVMTLNTYAHLFPESDDTQALAEAEIALLA